MIDGTFSFVRGVGPFRERELRARGIGCWDDFPASGVVLSAALDRRIREGIEKMRALVASRRLVEACELLPGRERWRLFPLLGDDVAYLDIETDFAGRVTVVGLYDPAGGPRLYVRGHNLGAFVEERLPIALVTFNGASFDVPVLLRTFPDWRPPPVHLDLRPILAQLGHKGGLKKIEERLGLGRPEHLKGVGGGDALDLWDRFRLAGEVPALAALLEYNLYDVVQLRSLAEIACEQLAALTGRSWAPERRFLRGDVLYDLTRCVAGVVEDSSRLVADLVEDAERRPLRRFAR